MIEGTRPYRRPTQQNVSPAKPVSPESQASEAASAKPVNLDSIVPAASSGPDALPKNENDAVDLDRRKWFASLIPSAGDGLVKLLRASNNLERDLRDGMKKD